MKTIITIRTWKCDCGYIQDFEATQENQDKHFNNDKSFPVNNLLEGECPNCKLQGKVGEIVKETDPEKKSTLIIMGEEDIETEIEAEDEERVKRGKAKRTEAEKVAHRIKRKQDIVEAIKAAKLLEDK